MSNLRLDKTSSSGQSCSRHGDGVLNRVPRQPRHTSWHGSNWEGGDQKNAKKLAETRMGYAQPLLVSNQIRARVMCARNHFERSPKFASSYSKAPKASLFFLDLDRDLVLCHPIARHLGLNRFGAHFHPLSQILSLISPWKLHSMTSQLCIGNSLSCHDVRAGSIPAQFRPPGCWDNAIRCHLRCWFLGADRHPVHGCCDGFDLLPSAWLWWIKKWVKGRLDCKSRLRVGPILNIKGSIQEYLGQSRAPSLIQSWNSDAASIHGSEAFGFCRCEQIFVRTSEMANRQNLNPGGWTGHGQMSRKTRGWGHIWAILHMQKPVSAKKSISHVHGYSLFHGMMPLSGSHSGHWLRSRMHLLHSSMRPNPPEELLFIMHLFTQNQKKLTVKWLLSFRWDCSQVRVNSSQCNSKFPSIGPKRLNALNDNLFTSHIRLFTKRAYQAGFWPVVSPLLILCCKFRNDCMRLEELLLALCALGNNVTLPNLCHKLAESPHYMVFIIQFIPE
jgi:hypothetical protein